MADYELPDRLQLIHFADLVTRAPSPWLIRDFLRQTSVAQIWGHRGSYKSFIALDIAASVATGLSWHGREVVDPGLVIYVAAEGGGGMVQRARAWAEQHGIHPSKVNLYFITEPTIVQGESDDMELLVTRIRELIDWYPEGTVDRETGHVYEHPVALKGWPVLIVIDTLARCFLGDENQQEDMGMFVQGVDRLKNEFGATILVLHHSGRAGDHERGSTALGGACDTIYRVEADKETKELTISSEKMKDSRDPEPVVLQFQEYQVARRPLDDPDEDLTSVVLTDIEAGMAERQEGMLQILQDAGPLTWADWFGLTGGSKATFNRQLVRLKKNAQIIKENGKWALS